MIQIWLWIMDEFSTLDFCIRQFTSVLKLGWISTGWYAFNMSLCSYKKKKHLKFNEGEISLNLILFCPRPGSLKPI